MTLYKYYYGLNTSTTSKGFLKQNNKCKPENKTINLRYSHNDDDRLHLWANKREKKER